MIAWFAIEDAVRAWVLAASELPDDSVYFADQGVRISENVPRIAIRIGGTTAIGQAELNHDYNAGRPAGQEIEYSAKQMLELVVELQAFSPHVVGSGVTARSVHEQCRARLDLPSVRDALNLEGLGVLAAGQVQRIPRPLGPAGQGEIEDRAIFEVRFNTRQTATERTGYIDKINGGAGPTGTVDPY